MHDEGIMPFLNYSWCLIAVCFHLPTFSSGLKLSSWSVAIAMPLEDSLNACGLSRCLHRLGRAAGSFMCICSRCLPAEPCASATCGVLSLPQAFMALHQVL